MIISGDLTAPSGFENICEDDNNVSKPYVLHWGERHYQSGAQPQTARRCHALRYRIAMHPVCQTHYSKRHKTSCLRRKLRIMDGIELLKRNIEVVFIEI